MSDEISSSSMRSIVDEMKVDQGIFRKRIDAVNQIGVVNERRNIGMNLVTFDSRNLPKKQVLGMIAVGHRGGGKSHVLEQCCQLFSEQTYYMLTAASQRSLYYTQEDLRHRVLILAEAHDLKGDNSLSYFIRSMLSEGRADFEITKSSGSGSRRIQKEGPMPFISTTAVEQIEEQLLDRLIQIQPDMSVAQTCAVMRSLGLRAAGLSNEISDEDLMAWKLFHDEQEPVKVILPYGKKLGELTATNRNIRIALRRAFKNVISLTQAIASFHQFQRRRDSQGSVLANEVDYHLARQLAADTMEESSGRFSEEDESRIQIIQENGPVSIKTLAGEMGISIPGVSKWAKRFCEEGVIIWCDNQGNVFPNETVEKREKASGHAFLKVDEGINLTYEKYLPTTFLLTDDPEWKEGGSLFTQYDLELSRRM